MNETIWDLLRGAIATRTLGIVAELRVADALAGGPRPIAELASEVGADPDALNRYLRALASDGVFAEVERGVYRNTESSEMLRGPAGAFAELFGGAWHGAVGALDASGRPAMDDFWGWLSEHPKERALFDLAMEEGKERRVERFAGVEWRDGETVVDVGGGNGSFLLELVARRSGLRGIVFDLPETVRDEAALSAAGIEFVEGSFFERVPPGDSYVLGTILHDWDDEHATAILRTIREHAPSGARVLVIDAVIPPGNDPDGAKWLDLLILATLGGRERTEPEWRSLVEGAGLRLDRIDDLIHVSCP
jgi:O-methyltransferase domain